MARGRKQIEPRLGEERYERTNESGSSLELFTGELFEDGEDKITIATDGMSQAVDIDLREAQFVVDTLLVILAKSGEPYYIPSMSSTESAAAGEPDTDRREPPPAAPPEKLPEPAADPDDPTAPLRARVLDLLGPRRGPQWLSTPVEELGGRNPVEAYKGGDTEQVDKLVEELVRA